MKILTVLSLLYISIIFSTQSLQASDVSGCEPIIEITKVFDCKNPSKKCDVEIIEICSTEKNPCTDPSKNPERREINGLNTKIAVGDSFIAFKHTICPEFSGCKTNFQVSKKRKCSSEELKAQKNIEINWKCLNLSYSIKKISTEQEIRNAGADICIENLSVDHNNKLIFAAYLYLGANKNLKTVALSKLETYQLKYSGKRVFTLIDELFDQYNTKYSKDLAKNDLQFVIKIDSFRMKIKSER